jgi:hypothetical protein
MLIISPLTRALAHDFLEFLYYLTNNTFQLLWQACTSSPQSTHQIQQSDDTALRKLTLERDQAIQAYAVLTKEKADWEAEEIHLNDEIKLQKHILDSTTTQLQLERADSKHSPVHAEKAALQSLVEELQQTLSNQDNRVDTVNNENSKIISLYRSLERSFTRLTAEKDTVESAANDTSAREANALEENERLQRTIAQQKGTLYEYGKVITLHSRVLEVLYQLSEQTEPERLSVAVGFAKAMQLDGVRLAELGVDERRFKALWRYVAEGMGEGSAVQPQGHERGFRCGERPSVENGFYFRR